MTDIFSGRATYVIDGNDIKSRAHVICIGCREKSENKSFFAYKTRSECFVILRIFGQIICPATHEMIYI